MRRMLVPVMLACFASARFASAQTPASNIDESKVPPYTLPDPLLCLDGTKVTTPQQWQEKRRPEILELFCANMQGRSPPRPADMTFRVTSTDAQALHGLATRKEITISFAADKTCPQLHLLLYVPNAAAKPVPAFIGINMDGNQTVSADPGITITPQWTWDDKAKTESLVLPAQSTRGHDSSSWPLETILGRGYAVATFTRADIEPDYPDGWKHGIRGYYLAKSGKAQFAPDDWGAVAAWAWGLSRSLDYLQTDKDIDAKHVAVLGHSRLGKAALWAGAIDPRFAVVISNESGEGGAALARRWFGETTALINKNFPHWFCGNFKQFSNHEDRMPTDQHELLALIAPRPLYVASAEEDKWSDPRGEFLALKNAQPVWNLFGLPGLGVDDMPPVSHPVGDIIRYHIRPGKHDITAYDWAHYLNFADKYLRH